MLPDFKLIFFRINFYIWEGLKMHKPQGSLQEYDDL